MIPSAEMSFLSQRIEFPWLMNGGPTVTEMMIDLVGKVCGETTGESYARRCRVGLYYLSVGQHKFGEVPENVQYCTFLHVARASTRWAFLPVVQHLFLRPVHLALEFNGSSIYDHSTFFSFLPSRAVCPEAFIAARLARGVQCLRVGFRSRQIK